jgi:hypothetical protein
MYSTYLERLWLVTFNIHAHLCSQIIFITFLKNNINTLYINVCKYYLKYFAVLYIYIRKLQKKLTVLLCETELCWTDRNKNEICLVTCIHILYKNVIQIQKVLECETCEMTY